MITMTALILGVMALIAIVTLIITIINFLLLKILLKATQDWVHDYLWLIMTSSTLILSILATSHILANVTGVAK